MTRCADIAVPGFWPIGLDAQNDDAAQSRLGNGLLHGLGEGCGISDCLVGEGDDQNGVLARLCDCQRSKRQGGVGVAANGLEQGCAQLNASFAQLLGGQKTMVFTRDNEWRRHLNAVTAKLRQAFCRLLKQAVSAG